MVTRRPSFHYQALIAVLAVPMLMAVLNSLSGFWRLETASGTVLLYAGAAVALAWLLWRVPWATVTLLAMGAAGSLLALPYQPAWAAYVRRLSGEWYDFMESMRIYQLEAAFGQTLGDLFLILIAVGVGAVLIRETLARGSTFWSIALGTAIFGIQWSWYYDKSFGHFAAYLVIAFMLWALGQAALREASWQVTGRRVGYRTHLATPLASILLVGLLASLLPAEFAPADLGAFGERVQEAFPILKRLRGAGPGSGLGGRFSLRTTGFAPTMGVLGGPVTLDHKVALHLKTKDALTGTAYLRGATHLTYDGRTWLSGGSAYLDVGPDQVIPSQYSATVLRDAATFGITPAVNMGNTLFSLLEPVRVENPRGGYKVDGDGNLWSSRAVPKGTTYQVYVNIPRYSSEQIRRLSTGLLPESFEAYLQIPSSLPDRVGDLARSLAGGQADPLEQALTIERYLRSFPYSLEVPASPSGRDFVDYFLFDLQRGYCTYYATAMAVMLRELGIPTRLVEGFAVPSSAQYTEGADGLRSYSVLNSMAHAWVEAYFPGYGWITFEPTPRGDLPLIDRSVPAPATDSASDPLTGGDDLPFGDPDDLLEDDFDEAFAGGAGTGGAGLENSRQLPWGLTLLAALAGLIYMGYRRIQSQDRIPSKEEGQVVQEAWTRSGSLLALFNLGRRPDQTPREYARVLGQQWSSLQEPAERVADDYTYARFGPPHSPLDTEAAGRARQLWEKVQEAVFNRFGWRRYLWRRLRWPAGKPD